MAHLTRLPRPALLTAIVAVSAAFAGCFGDDEPSSSAGGDDYTPPPQPEDDPIGDIVPEAPDLPELPPPGVVTFMPDAPRPEPEAETIADCGIRIGLLGLRIAIATCP